MIQLFERAAPLLDASGGTLVLRGANVCGDAKRAPDRLATLGAAELSCLRDVLGLDAVRLVVFWEAIEPAPGRYDERYLAAIRERVLRARAYDVEVVIDMHQDLFGRAFGQAGAPAWATAPALAATYRPQTPWMLGYLSSEVGSAFDALYAPGPLRAAFVRAWARLARALRGAGVLAYDLLNEPGWGTQSPESFERDVAPGLYAELAAAIRAEDGRAVVAVEPAATASMSASSVLLRPPCDGLVYAPHAYAPALELGHGYDPSRDAPAASIRALATDARRLGMPLLVGELGVRRDIPGAARYLSDAYDALDSEMASALAWDFGRGDERSYALLDPGGAPTEIAHAVARPYPRRIAGRARGWAYDASRGRFALRWHEPDADAGVTRLVLPRLAFPNGARVRVDRGPWSTTSDRELHIPARGTERLCEVERLDERDLAAAAE